MCTTSETCRANSVIKTAPNNLHQAGPNKTHIAAICLAWVALMLSVYGQDVNLDHIVPVVNSKYYLSNGHSFENCIIAQKSAVLIYFAAET